MRGLRFEGWDVFGVWDLDFGASLELGCSCLRIALGGLPWGFHSIVLVTGRSDGTLEYEDDSYSRRYVSFFGVVRLRQLPGRHSR